MGIADSTTHYYYDGWRVLTETDVDGETETLLREYVYGNYLDEVLVKTEDEEDIYYAHDHLFSAVALLDESGDVLERYEYDAYGKPYFYDPNFVLLATQKSNYNNLILFTGQRFDRLDNGDLEKYHYKGRDLEILTGRFYQRDPLGVNPSLVNYHSTGSPILMPTRMSRQYTDGVSLYEYVRSSPILNSDTTGLSSSKKSKADCGCYFKRVSVIWKDKDGKIDWKKTLSHDPHAMIDCGKGNSWGFYGTGSVRKGDSLGVASQNVVSKPLVKKDHGFLEYGMKEGKKIECKCATCDDIIKCIQGFADYTRINKTVYKKDSSPSDLLPWYDHYHCWDWAKDAAKKCCLKFWTPPPPPSNAYVMPMTGYPVYY